MNNSKLKLDKGAKHILVYGVAAASLIFGLEWLQWNFLIADTALDLYIGLIAVVFTLLGMWVATQLIKPKTVFVEKQNQFQRPAKFIVNQVELERLNLTNREYQILQLLVQGDSNADIANQLFLSISTIKTHVSNLYIKMHVKNRFQALTEAKRLQIVE